MNNNERDVTRRASMLIVTVAMFLFVSWPSVSLNCMLNPLAESLWILNVSITIADRIGPTNTAEICWTLLKGFLLIIMMRERASTAEVICTDKAPKS